MKKMIGVINDNLRSVVNGIKEHRSDTEKSLTAIKSDIDTKVEIASKYKSEVEGARSIILGLETEVSELENDLKELNEKFGSKDFKEIVAVGDKEINSKINEKKQLIAEQNEIIINITKKAHTLKRELTKLKDRKDTIESDLNKTVILESYYEKRISAIIDFSIEHPEELATYKEIDEVDDLNTEEIEDIDIGNIIDGQVFNEIDSISGGAVPNEEELMKALNIDEDDDEDSEDGLSKIDDVIDSASEVIDNNELNETLESDTTMSGIEDVVIESLNDKNTDEAEELDSKEDEIESTSDTSVDVEDIKPIDLTLIEPVEEHKKLHTMSEPVTVNLDVFDQKDENNLSEIVFGNDSSYSLENLTECGLNADDFTSEDLKLLEKGFDKANTLEFIEVLKKHGLDPNIIYSSVGVLLNVTPQNLNKILTMLEGVSERSDIEYVFRYLDKVNVNRLEQNIALSSDEDSLTELLITTLSDDGNADLSNLLGITSKEVSTIKRNAIDDYRLMVNFPEIVFANYSALKSYNIDNLVECITKYPHRFTINPSKFSAILDKYDANDLVRCVNKNAAVIDKL